MLVPEKPTPPRIDIREAFGRYAIGVCSVAAGLALRFALAGVLGSTVPYITFFPAVMFAAWLGGLGPGILATALSLIAAFYFVISAPYPPSPAASADTVGAIVFVGVSIFISVLNEALRRSRARSDERFRELTLETVRRRRVEEALAKSMREAEGARDLLHTILSSIGDAVIATNAEGKVTFLNPVAQDLTGWSQEDAAGKASSEVFDIRDERTRVPSESPIEKVIREGVAVRLANHTVLVTRDGRYIPIEDSAAPIRDEQNRIHGVVLVFRDVTDRRRAEDALKRSEERLKLALNAGRIGVWDWDVFRNHIEWSDLVYDIHGVERGKFSGTVDDFAQLVHPEDRDRINESIQAALRDGVPYDVEFRVVHGDGSVHWVSTTALVFRDEKGEPTRMLGATTDVTARKLAETHVRRQWHTFDIALSNSPDFAYIFDLEGRFTYINRALLSLWQKSFEESVGKNFFELGYPSELAARLQSQIQHVIETKELVRDQTPYALPDGETRYYEYIFVPVLAANGRVEAVTGSTRDITERTRMEGLVQRDRRRWRDLLLQAPAAIAVLRGPEHQFEWVNTDYLRLVGHSPEEIIGKSVLEALPEVGRQIYVDLLNRVITTGEPFVGHESLVSFDLEDGTVKDAYVNFVFQPTRDDAGKIDGVFVHATEVTDMVLARQHIEESERQFRTLAESIPHLAWMADETGHVFWYNRRWYDYTGTTFEEMQGQTRHSVHDPAFLPEVLKKWRGAIESGEPFEMVFPLKAADNAFRSFLTRIEPVKDNQGRVVRWFGTNTDITDQLETQEELRRMNRELEEFAYVASHDLQEPLRMVNIYTQLILRSVGEKNATLNQYGEFVRQGVLRMEMLIRDLLTFSRAVHAEELSVGSADLSAAFTEALSVLKNRIEESGAVIHTLPLPTVRGDTLQMAHVFQNLLSNALKYRKQEVPPEIHIAVEEDGEQWIVSIRDNGIGFEQQYAERIFGLFKRLHKDEYAGTGLGLAICKRIVERYGGRMWADGRPGEGATFYFALPRAEGH